MLIAHIISAATPPVANVDDQEEGSDHGVAIDCSDVTSDSLERAQVLVISVASALEADLDRSLSQWQ